jgi:hypothetical protein
MGDRSGLWSAHAVGFGSACVVVDLVTDRGDVQQVGHLRRPALALLPAYTPVLRRCSRLQ